MEDAYDDIFLDGLTVDPTTGEVKRRTHEVGSLFNQGNPMEDRKVRYSVTLIKSYQTCGAQAWGKITKQPGKKGGALVRGIAVHEALEALAKEKKDPMQVFYDSFKAEAAKNKMSPSSDEYSDMVTDGQMMVERMFKVMSKPAYNGRPFFETIQPELVEKFVSVERKGRLFVGKLDLMHFPNPNERPEDYVIMDYKTSKNPPSQFELDNDIQFGFYSYAAFHDQTLTTSGLWASRGVWLQCRGKSKKGSRLSNAEMAEAKKDPEKYYTFSFPTKAHTPEHVEDLWVNTMEPAIAGIESGIFPRVYNKMCGWCDFFDKEKGCTVDLPTRTLIHEREAKQEAIETGLVATF